MYRLLAEQGQGIADGEQLMIQVCRICSTIAGGMVTEEQRHIAGAQFGWPASDLCPACAELFKDKARLDWLEKELEREIETGHRQALFRRNLPITRKDIDKEMGR